MYMDFKKFAPVVVTNSKNSKTWNWWIINDPFNGNPLSQGFYMVHKCVYTNLALKSIYGKNFYISSGSESVTS